MISAQPPARPNADRDAMVRLHELVARLLDCPDLTSSFDEVLVASMEITGAPKGNVQLLDANAEVLVIAAHHGFDQDFLTSFRCVRVADDDTACGRAVREGARVIVEDVETEPSYEPYREIASRAGYRAVQSTPLISPVRGRIGVLSTHYAEPYRPSEQELRMLDLYAQQAASLIERYQSEQALRDSTARFDSVVGQSTVGIVESDQQGRFVFVNDRYCEITGRSREELLSGIGMAEITHPEDLPESVLLVRTMLETGRSYVIEKRYVRPDGSDVWVMNSVTPIFDEERRVVGGTAVSVDITDRKRAEEGLVAAKLAAEEAHQVKSRFLAVMSHELRTPLSSVLGYVRLLEDEVLGPMSPQQRNAISRIKTSTSFQADMIEEILGVMRLEARSERVRWEEVDVAELTAEIIGLLRPGAEEKSLRLRMSTGQVRQEVRTDRAKLRKILMNLLANAVKYTDRGGVTVELEGVAPDALEVHVRDTGPGIPYEHHEAVFQAFRQVDDSLTRTASGTGLGLAISRSLAHLMGGELTLVSVPGEGSTFSLRLPRVPRESED